MLFTLTLYGWGSTGHYAIGSLTMSMLSPALQSTIQDILVHDDTSNEDLGKASIWADTVKRTTRFQWTANLHFLDTVDNPPNSCTLLRIPTTPNVVSAVADFYSRLGSSDSRMTPAQELKFFVHLLQDLHQPLHVEGEARGGNELIVYFNNRKTNLHAAWDTDMINKRIKDDFNNDSAAWIDSLKSKSQSQLCFKSCQAISCQSTDTTTCLLQWAQFTNALNCDTVWDFQGNELTDEYYQRNINLIEDLLVVAATRTAQWLTMKYQ